MAEALLGIELMQLSREMLAQFTKELGELALECVLNASAASVAGERHCGVKGGPIKHWGSQPGSVRMGAAKTRIAKPRLRNCETGREVAVPAYETLKRDPKAGARVLKAALRGVSSRDYKEVVAQSAEALGVSRSSISRQVVESSSERVKELMETALCARMLAVIIDGIRFAGHLVVGAIGVDEAGKKHVLGIALGATENAATVKSLLTNLRDRGLTKPALFVLDGAKALSSAVREVYGESSPIQRCRYHKRKNVVDRLPQRMAMYAYRKMSAAYNLGYPEGMKRMLEFAKELETTHPGAAASLREGIEETFTVSKLGLPPLLVQSLGTSNLLESVHSMIRTKTNRLKNMEEGADVERWAASAFLDVEGSMKTLNGHKDLWMLRAALDKETAQEAG